MKMKDFKKLIIYLSFSICLIGYNSTAEAQQESQPPAPQAETADTYLDSGIEKAKSGEYEEAIAHLDEAIDLDPRLADAYYNRGLVYYNHGLTYYDFDEEHLSFLLKAIDDLDTAIDINPRDALAYHARGLVKMRLRKYKEAIDDLDKTIEINTRLAEAHREAIDDLDTVIEEIDTQLAEAYTNRGIIKSKLGRYRHYEAIDDLNTAIEINPRLAEAYYHRALVIRKYFRRDEEAIDDLNIAIEINPRFVDAYLARASVKIHLEDGRSEEAIDDLDRVIQMNSLNEDHYYKLGTLNTSLERHAEAIAHLDKVIEINPRSARAYYARGIANIRLGRHEAARADLKRLLELEPNNVDALLLTLAQRKSEKTNSGSCPLVLIRLKSEDRPTFIQRLLQRMTN